jgi:hypothetical protein
MSNSLKQFHKNIDSINTIDGIYIYFESQVKAIDLSEILRAQYVLLVSAFDCYIHDIVREGMLNIFDGKENVNHKYENFLISVKTLNLMLSTGDKDIRRQLLDAEIRKVTTKHSYQAPLNVENALSLIAFKSVWKSLSAELKMLKDDIPKELSLIVNRRNKIAHEADIDPVTNDKTAIDRQTIIDVKTFITKLVTAIDKKT